MVDINGSIQAGYAVGTLPDFSEEGLPQSLRLEDTNTGPGDGNTEHPVHEANLDLAAPQVIQVFVELRAEGPADETPQGFPQFVLSIRRGCDIEPVTEYGGSALSW